MHVTLVLLGTLAPVIMSHNHAEGGSPMPGSNTTEAPTARLQFSPFTASASASTLEMVLGGENVDGNLDQWFANVYQKQWWHGSSNSTREADGMMREVVFHDAPSPLLLEAVVSPLVIELFDLIPSDETLVGAVSVRSDGGEREQRAPLAAQAAYIKRMFNRDGNTPELLPRHLSKGGSFALKLDRLPACLVDGADPTAPPPALIGLHRKVSKAFNAKVRCILKRG